MRIKDYAAIHHSKYWMPIHYDTIKDEQNKKSDFLFSKFKTWQSDPLVIITPYLQRYPV